MLVVVLVKNRRRVGVIRRVNVNAPHLPLVPLLQQIQPLKILPVHQQAVERLFHRAGFRQRRQQSVFERVVEVFGVQHQMRMLFQEFRRERFARGRRRGIQRFPFRMLSFVFGDGRVQRLRHFVEGCAILRFQHEFLFQPELFLEVFQLREEVDDFVADQLDGFQLRQTADEHHRVIRQRQVVDGQHIAFQKRVQFAAQKTAQVFVDEIIETVLGGVHGDVFAEQRALGVRFGRAVRQQ